MTKFRGVYVSSKEFIEVYMHFYNQGGSASDVAKALGKPINIVHNASTYLRKRGVNLPYWGRGGNNRPKLDIDYLNRLIEDSK